ncbi:IMP cyclohydrolase [Actinoplanes sp. NPDC051411]|uniref:IMP cyclohydrolase n=1 Tax=Actinoplanes sp. NPDC051411 TaxID=3155522 RepID=UPI0034167485
MIFSPYPGRVLILARTGDGTLAGIYALTGRSESSRRRQIIQLSPAELRVAPLDDHDHDSLRHYTAALSDEQWTVFGNGEQVGTVFDRLFAGAPPAVALDDLSYEPDPPLHTPRITAVVSRSSGTVWLGAARRPDGLRSTADVTVTTVREMAVSDALTLTTYDSDGSSVAVAATVDEFTTPAATPDDLLDEVWSSLDPAYRVAAALLSPMSGAGATLRHA